MDVEGLRKGVIVAYDRSLGLDMSDGNNGISAWYSARSHCMHLRKRGHIRT